MSPLVVKKEARTKDGRPIPHELQGAVYTKVMCTCCASTRHLIKPKGATSFTDRPCPRCGHWPYHLRTIPTVGCDFPMEFCDEEVNRCQR